jgi:DNA-binding NtrC family response regulator
VDREQILIVDEDEAVHKELRDLIASKFQLECEHCFDKDDAISLCKEDVYKLIIVDPLLPSTYDGEDFIKEQRQFYSINEKTPMILFTEDIDFVKRITETYQNIHPETKQGAFSKILAPIEQALKEKR